VSAKHSAVQVATIGRAQCKRSRRTTEPSEQRPGSAASWRAAPIKGSMTLPGDVIDACKHA